MPESILRTKLFIPPIKAEPHPPAIRCSILPSFLLAVFHLTRLAYLAGDNPDSPLESNLLGIAVAKMSESKLWEPVVCSAQVRYIRDWSPDGLRLQLDMESASVAEIIMGQPVINQLISGENNDLFSNIMKVDNVRFRYSRQHEAGWDIFWDMLT